MKATGIIRTIDNVGRFVLPSEVREIFGVRDPGSKLEVFVDNDSIILKKYEPTCIFCGSLDDIIDYKNNKICKKCIDNLVKIKEIV